jgi:TorA maturation chaperone TorD
MPDRVELLIAHELAYSFLSRAFYESPSKELIDTLAADELFDAWPLETSHTEAETGLALLRNFCATWRSEDLGALEHDYLQLFVGPGHLQAAPWESVYRSPDHLLFSPDTLAVRHEFQRFGMPIPNLGSEPDDHLGLELRFIAHLSELGLTAIDHDRPDVLDVAITEIRSFLSDHLLQWAPECLNLVIEKAESDYYRGCAHLALGCLAHTNQAMELETA